MQGIIRVVDSRQKWGFIRRKGEPGPNVYFRFDDLAEPLQAKWGPKLVHRRVEFELRDTPRGQRAVNIGPCKLPVKHGLPKPPKPKRPAVPFVDFSKWRDG